MKIQIQKKGKTIFTLWLPNLLLTSKFAAKMFLKLTKSSKTKIQMAQVNSKNTASSSQEQRNEQSKTDLAMLEERKSYSKEKIQNVQACMATLKKYIKKYGHFTLVEVQSTDCSVLIRV